MVSVVKKEVILKGTGYKEMEIVCTETLPRDFVVKETRKFEWQLDEAASKKVLFLYI